MKKSRIGFNGSILYLSLSPHGDPEGIVLDDGTFVKCPPHSVLKKDLFVVGAEVKGEGELVVEDPNRVIHHAVVKIGSKILADDSGTKEEREALKEKHKEDLSLRKPVREENLTIEGRLAAIATKPKGEIDRMILEDGTSIHIPKHVQLPEKSYALGGVVKVQGQSRQYGDARFVKAEKVTCV